MTNQALILVILAGANSCIGNVLLKFSQRGLPQDAGVLERFASLSFVGGLAFYVVNVLLFAKALESAPVSSAYPILAGSGFALLAVASYYAFGESLAPAKLAGIGVIMAGITILALAEKAG
jgi:multidrug transporter EmrE-like cation transporter